MPSINKKCLVCGKEFFIRPCRLKTAKYCSKACHNQAMKGIPNPRLSEWNRGRISPRRISDDVLIADIKRVASELDRSPISTEYATLGRHDFTTILRAFKSWHSAVLQAGLIPIPTSELKSESAKRRWQSIEYRKKFTGPNHWAWQGGTIHYRGPNWAEQSAKARSRAQYKCQRCGISETELGQKLDVHHIIPFRSFGYIVGENDLYLQANDLSNLSALCPSCHARSRHLHKE